MESLGWRVLVEFMRADGSGAGVSLQESGPMEDTELVEEDGKDTQRTDKADEEEIDSKECTTQGAAIGQLVAHRLFGHEPAEEDASEETADRQEYLGSEEIEQIEERQTEK